MKHLPVIAGMLVLAVSGAAYAQASKAPAVALFGNLDASATLDDAHAARVMEVVAARLRASGRLDPLPVVVRAPEGVEQAPAREPCTDTACRIEAARGLEAAAMLSMELAETDGRCKVGLALYGVRKSSLEAASTATGACDEAGIEASARSATATLLNAWLGYDPAVRARLVTARNAGMGLTVTGIVLMVAGGIAGGVMVAGLGGCGTVVNDECSNFGAQMSGIVVLVSVVPIGAALIVAGGPVWGVYQRRIDRFDAAASKASLVGVGPLYDSRTGAKGLAATFAF